MSSKKFLNRVIGLTSNARRQHSTPVAEKSFCPPNASKPHVRSITSSCNAFCPGPPNALSFHSSRSSGFPVQALTRTHLLQPEANVVTTPQRRHASNGSQSLARTPFYDLHVKHGAKFSPFAGYEMPLYYSDLSHAESHHWVREKCGLFDVSHMYVVIAPLVYLFCWMSCVFLLFGSYKVACLLFQCALSAGSPLN